MGDIGTRQVRFEVLATSPRPEQVDTRPVSEQPTPVEREPLVDRAEPARS